MFLTIKCLTYFYSASLFICTFWGFLMLHTCIGIAMSKLLLINYHLFYTISLPCHWNRWFNIIFILQYTYFILIEYTFGLQYKLSNFYILSIMCSLIVVSLTPNQINFNQFLKWKNHTWKLPKTFNYKWEGFCTLGDKDKIAKVLSRTIKISSPWTTGPVFLYLISYLRSYVFIDLNWFLRWAMWPMGLLFLCAC